MAIVVIMRALAPLLMILLFAVSGARAGETRCWFENGAVVVPAAIGPIAGDFLLDPSTPHSQLHDTVAQTWGFEGDHMRGDLIVAGEKRRGYDMPIISLDARSWGFVTGISGVIGADVLAPYLVDIQFSPCVVRFQRRVSKSSGGIRLPIRLVAGIPAVPAAISDGTESRQGWFAIDTASDGVRIAGAALSRTPPKDIDPASRTHAPARLRALSLGGHLFEQTPAGLMKDAPAGLDGAIGDAVWSRYRMRLNLKGGWLELTPAP